MFSLSSSSSSSYSSMPVIISCFLASSFRIIWLIVFLSNYSSHPAYRCSSGDFLLLIVMIISFFFFVSLVFLFWVFFPPLNSKEEPADACAQYSSMFRDQEWKIPKPRRQKQQPDPSLASMTMTTSMSMTTLESDPYGPAGKGPQEVHSITTKKVETTVMDAYMAKYYPGVLPCL